MSLLNNLIESLCKMNEISIKTIKYGLQFSVGISFIGFVIYLINKNMYIFNYSGEGFGIQMILAGLMLFVEFITGGIFLDIILKRTGK